MTSRSGQAPPRLADRILARVLPLGKRGESILGDLREEYRASPSQWWYWKQTLLLSVRYLASRSPQQDLSYPRSRGMWFESSGDVKTAFRSLTRSPGTSALIVFTLAFAIAAATIGFAFADLAPFRGLPVDDTSKVVSVEVNDAQGSMTGVYRVSGPDFLDYKSRATTIEAASAFRYASAPLIRNGQSQTLRASFATADFFTAMGQRALHGRVFAAGDDQAGSPLVAVLAHHYWQREMASRANVIGTTVQIGRDHYTIVGIAAPELEFGSMAEIEMWLPLRIDAAGQRDLRTLRFVARLKDGVSFGQAAAELSAIGGALAQEHPATNAGWTVRLVPINDLIGGGGFWVVIALFLLSIALLMAIATANVSNLVMVKTLARSRELAVRTALGARKGRLIRQFLTEGVLLSVIAAAVSLPLAWGAIAVVVTVSEQEIFKQLRIDVHEVSFVATLALICPLMFSVSPIRMMLRPDLRAVLAAAGSRGSTATNRGRGVLVVVQMALAVILLTVSSLALRSMREMYAAPTGIETSKLLLFTLEFNDALYPAIGDARAAAAATFDGLSRIGGVETVATVDTLPMLGDRGPLVMTIDGQVPAPQDARPTAVVTAASHDVDRALGLRIVAGEWWREGAANVAVVSAETARRYFGGTDLAVGRRVSLTQGERLLDARVVGVVSNVANPDRTQLPPPRVWVPLDAATRRFTYLLRAAQPAALIPEVRSVIAAHAATVPLESLRTFDEALSRAASSDYAVIGVLSAFAGLALLLASTGLFGVVSYTAAQRTAEFGTRIALGASAVDVARLVARDSARLLLIGLTLGLAGGIGVGFLMKSLLYGLSPLDPMTLGSVVAVLTAVTLTATAIPAWRASRIDPVIALRAD
ncbi:MAG TPA: ABC transporter permease [Vicinamibacterales bacterium]|nr:ABC transporter permease [Vicinamibacterales bacterium]